MATATAELSAATPTERRIRILTTQHKHWVPVWRDAVEMMPGWDEAGKFSGFKTFLWAWKLFRASRHYDAIVTGSKRPEHIFAALQWLLRRKHRVPHTFIYAGWNLPRSKWKAWIKLQLYRAYWRGVSRIVIFSKRQEELYCRGLNVPAHKFVIIPYHLTLWDTKFEVKEGDYIFTGGDSTRDYRTMLKALRGLPYKVRIACRSREHFVGMAIPPHVEIGPVSEQEFMNLMAGAALVVVPLAVGQMHLGGQQTYQNAMAMGKPVIVSDDCGADEYVTNGVDGILLSPGDMQGMRAAIVQVMSDAAYAKRLGENGRRAMQDPRYEPKYFLTKLLEAVRESVAERQGAGR